MDGFCLDLHLAAFPPHLLPSFTVLCLSFTNWKGSTWAVMNWKNWWVILTLTFKCFCFPEDITQQTNPHFPTSLLMLFPDRFNSRFMFFSIYIYIYSLSHVLITIFAYLLQYWQEKIWLNWVGLSRNYYIFLWKNRQLFTVLMLFLSKFLLLFLCFFLLCSLNL